MRGIVREELIHQNLRLSEATYPATAEEYAKEIDAGIKERGAWGGLVTDPEHWAEVDVHTGEDLARYLAIEAHHNAYKEVHGMRPRHMEYDSMSIDEIEAETEELYRDQD